VKARILFALAAIAFLRRSRDVRVHPDRDPSEPDEQAILNMLVDRAATRLEAQLQDADEIAGKALAVLAIDLSAAAVLISARADLAEFWPLVVAGFGLAIVLLCVSIWPRTFDTGPEPADFYATFGGASRLSASRQMLSELTYARDVNSTRARRKGQFFRYGFVASLVTGLGAIPVVLGS